MSNGPSVAPRQHSGTECLPPRNQPPRPRIAQLRKTLPAFRDTTPNPWPRFGGAFLVWQRNQSPRPELLWRGSLFRECVSYPLISASPLTPSQGRGFSCNMTANDNQISEETRTGTLFAVADTRRCGGAKGRPVVCRAALKERPRVGGGAKVDRVRHLKPPVSPSPPIPQRCIGSNHEAGRYGPSTSVVQKMRPLSCGTVVAAGGSFRG
jgi:hypothetical protein